MDARDLLETQRRGQVIDEQLRLFLWGLTSTTARDAAATTADFWRSGTKEPNLGNAEELRRIADQFHQSAGTRTPAIARAIDALSSKPIRLRFSHQINLFASIGIFAQFAMLDALSTFLARDANQQSMKLFAYIDYDVANDVRFKTAHFPSVGTNEGTLALTGAVRIEDRAKPMYSIEKPSRQLIGRWIDQIRSCVFRDKVQSGSQFLPLEAATLNGRFALLESLIWRSYNAAESLVSFNAIFTSVVCNELWNYDVVFLPGSRLQSTFVDGYRFLLLHEDAIKNYWNEAVQKLQDRGITVKPPLFSSSDALIWWICPTCSTRLQLRKVGGSSYSVDCRICGTSPALSTEGLLETIALHPGRVLPRIVLDDLLDYVSFGMTGGTSYIGASEHRILSNYVAFKMGMTPSPEISWAPHALSTGPVELAARGFTNEGVFQRDRLRWLNAMKWLANGRASILYYLLYAGHETTKRALDAFVANSSVDEFFFIAEDETIANGRDSLNFIQAHATSLLRREGSPPDDARSTEAAR